MDVDPHKSLQPQLGLGIRTSKKRVEKSTADAVRAINDGGSLFIASDLQEVIRQSLDSMPDVRQELVEVGRELADDENYPSAEGLDELSLLVLKQFSQARDDTKS